MRTGCGIVVFFLVLGATLGLLVGLRMWELSQEAEPQPEPTAAPTATPWSTPRPSVRPSARPSPRPTDTPLPDVYQQHVAALNRFRRAESEGAYLLTYGFVDYQGRTREMTCRIRQADHRAQVAGFGYERAELDAETDRRLQSWVDGEIDKRGLAAYVRVNVSNGYTSEWTVPPLEPAESRRVKDEIQAFLNWLDPAYRAKWDAVFGSLLRERGFLLENDRIGIDYAGVTFRSGRPLGDCFAALARATADDTERQRLGTFLAFFQELRYELPPDVVDGRRKTGGLFVPAEVLVGAHGDCDSKSVAFATLWRNFSSAVLLVEVPDHMLIGVEARPGPGLRSVRIGNRYFVLCEVAGPGKWHPGAKGLSGHFEYWLLEPAGSERPRAIRGESIAGP